MFRLNFYHISYLSEKQLKISIEKNEKLDRRTVTILYLKVSPKYLKEYKANAVYSIPCKCENNVYMGKTYRMFETWNKEHEAKVRRSGFSPFVTPKIFSKIGHCHLCTLMGVC